MNQLINKNMFYIFAFYTKFIKQIILLIFLFVWKFFFFE